MILYAQPAISVLINVDFIHVIFLFAVTSELTY